MIVLSLGSCFYFCVSRACSAPIETGFSHKMRDLELVNRIADFERIARDDRQSMVKPLPIEPEVPEL